MYPYLFKIGSFELRVYSLMLMLGVMLSLYFMSKKARELKLNPQNIENVVIITFLIGVLGARLYYVAFNWSYFSQYPSEILAVWKGGLAIHGGLIMGIVGGYFCCKAYKVNPFVLADLGAPFILLSQGIGRIGNFANGEAHGVPTVTPPSIIFQMKPIFGNFWNSTLAEHSVPNSPVGITAFYNKISQVGDAGLTTLYAGKEYLIKEYVPWGVKFPAKYMSQAYSEFGSMPVHPTFFYEMILNFIGAAILMVLWRKNSNIGSGKIFALFIAMYGVIRGFVTFFRADDLMFGAIRAPHLASLALFVIASAWYLFGKKANANVVKK